LISKNFLLFIIRKIIIDLRGECTEREGDMLDRISQRMIGYRINAAREISNWSQQQLAEELGFKDRQTISDLEKGKRALKPEELMQICASLDRDIDYFIDPFVIAGEGQFSWRADPALSQNELEGFELKAGQWIGLLRWLRESRGKQTSALKHTLRISASSSFEDAQKGAESLVKELDFGMFPGEQLLETVENKLDIPVLHVDTIQGDGGEWISGAACSLRDLAVILINRNEPPGRQNWDLAHELFHILTWDAMTPDHRELKGFEMGLNTKRMEQLADNFASALLMPKSSVEKILDLDKVTEIDYLYEISSVFRVTPMAFSWRLFNLKIIDDLVRCELSARKQDLSEYSVPTLFSSNFMEMLQETLANGDLSARKAAKTLDTDLHALADLFRQYNMAVPFDL
jgi:Zn-dependent peptidase ImmA (M78 family)/DNA-binding XRE family transcriptional regulator